MVRCDEGVCTELIDKLVRCDDGDVSTARRLGLLRVEAVPELGRDRVLDRQRVDVARRQREDGREDAADDLKKRHSVSVWIWYVDIVSVTMGKTTPHQFGAKGMPVPPPRPRRLLSDEWWNDVDDARK